MQQLHTEGGREFVMTPTQIFNWLKRCWATQKGAGMNLAIAAVPAAGEEDEGDGGGAMGGVYDEEGCWYSGMKCDQLRALLRAKGKPTGGIKADFIKRLEDEDESDGDATTSS